MQRMVGISREVHGGSTGCQLPLLLHPAWPPGVRLRFQISHSMRSRYHYLQGSIAIVLSELTLLDEGQVWLQQVMAVKPRRPEDRFLWVMPEHLAPVSPRQADALQRANLHPQLAVRQSHGEMLRSTVRHPFLT